MTWRRAVAVAAAMALGALAPASASAITIDSLTTQPANTQAGSHPNFTLSMKFGGGSTPKAMRIDLPPGFVGDPNAVAKCPQATFEAGNCGTDSIVGSTTVHTSSGLPGGGGGTNPLDPILNPLQPILDPLDPVTQPLCQSLPVLCGALGVGGTRATTRRATTRTAGFRRAKTRQALELPLSVPGTVYNLEPSPGEPARLGIEILESIRIQSVVDVRDTSDFGLTSLLDNLPNSFLGAPMRVTGMDLTLLGATPNGKAFVTLPTSCREATTRVNVTPYDGDPATASASFMPTGCENVPFTPTLNVRPSTSEIDSNAAYTITLGFPADEGPIHQAHVATTTVSLPEGTALNPGTAQGLEACPDAKFARGERKAPECPAASKIGTVSFASPLVGVLTGDVYEGEPHPGQMLRIFVDVPGPGFRIKLVGDVNPDPKTGQVHSVFRDLPQLPFTAFNLTFRGGNKSILVTPPTCGQYRSVAVLQPYSGQPDGRAESVFNATYTPEGGACPEELPFSPSVSVKTDPSTAGASTSMTQVVSRETKTQRLKDMELSFPPGLVGGLGGGIGLCEVGKARDGQCPDNSRVGSANLVAGPGPEPLNINGDVYIVAPFKEGTLASLAITVPGKVGPFDLGTTVSFAHISVRPKDSGLEVKANDLPQIVGGIPLNLRRVKLDLDRKGFMRNATSCAQQELTARFTAVGGKTSEATTPYQATDCDKVPFEPKLKGVIGDRSSVGKGAHPGVTAVVSQGEGEIAAKEVQVTLPDGVGVDVLKVGAVACKAGEDCGDKNTVGRATAITPLLPIPLSGPVKLVTPAGGGLPELELRLSGLLSITLAGKTALLPSGRVQNTFVGIPDVPLSRFELELKGGKDGILMTTRALRCGEELKGDGVFTGHNGRKHTTKGTFEVCGNLRSAASRGKKAKAKARAVFSKGVLRVTVKGAKKVKKVTVGLPKPAHLTGGQGVTAKGGKKARVTKVGKRSVTAKGFGKRKVALVLGKQSLRGGKQADKKDKKVTVKVAMAKGKHAKLRVKIR
ncbi:MAG TPA: hypothetical protein VFR97_12365 [Capillimicrobium sp.]|nr:hypothetical protein [Capillimicrobium sp.]